MTPAIQSLLAALEAEGYVADPATAMAVFLSREMRKPLLVEGDATADVAAQAFRADLVVLGTHHRRTFGLVPIGSVTDAVIAHATCPIVMVSEHAAEE